MLYSNQSQPRKVVKQLYPDTTGTSSSSSELNDAVETILLQAEARDHHNHHHSSSSSSSNAISSPSFTPLSSQRGKLTIHELEKISLLASSSSSTTYSTVNDDENKSNNKTEIKTSILKRSWATVNVDSLREFIGLLDEHIRCASKVDLIKYARLAFDHNEDGENGGSGDNDDAFGRKESLEQWLDMTPRNNSTCYQLTSILRQGLHAASLLISIMITPYIDRTLITEDTIDACIDLMKMHVQRNIIPSLSNIGHIAQYSPPLKKDGVKTTSVGGSGNNGSCKGDDKNIKPSKKKRKRSSSNINDTTTTTMSKPKQQNLVRFLKRAYKPILSQTVGQLVLLMERIDLLIQSVQVEDTSLNSISSAALSTVTIDPTSNEHSQSHVIQTSAIGLLSTIFRQYPKHRHGMVQDLIPLFLKLPTSKKSIRTYPVRYLSLTSRKKQQQCGNSSGSNLSTYSSISSSTGLTSPMKQKASSTNSDQGHIQVMSALLLFLIQSCVTIPTIPKPDIAQAREEQEEIDHRNEGRDDKAKTSFTSTGLEKCLEICTFFTSMIVDRCSKKGDEGGASEFRPILYNLIDDLLDIQLLPDFPAAEMLLREICRYLAHDLFQSSNSKAKEMGVKKVNFEQTYLATAFETVGAICSDIAFKLIIAKDYPFEFTRAIAPEDLSEDVDPSKEVNGCFCGQEKSNVFSLDCDRCHRWFHGNCLRIAKDDAPAHWICDECKMITMAIQQYGLHVDEGEELRDEERADIMRLVLLKYLSQQIQKTESIVLKDARHFHIAKFVESRSGQLMESEQLQNGKNTLIPHLQYLSMWSTSDVEFHDSSLSSKVSLSNEYLSEAGNTRVMISLYASKSKLVQEFRNILGVLVELMGDEDSSYLRRDAVKAIAQVIRADSSLMYHKNIREAVSKRFKDESKSVRDSAMALVGSYILQEPNMAIYFHESLLERLNDDGISVRKRAIRIFRDIITNDPTYKERTIVFAKLLQQAADRKEDDGVRDLIHETFRSLWFTVRKTHETAKQMIEMLRAIPNSQHYLTAIVKEMLVVSEGDKAKPDSKEIQIVIQRHCTDIVRYLFEELITFEEKRAMAGPHQSDGPLLVSLLSTIGVYAESCPNLLLKDYPTVLPYMKADNGVNKSSEASIVYTISKIISRLSSILSVSEVQKLGNSDLPTDLMKITYEFDSKPTNAAVELLSKLATRSSNLNSSFMTTLMKLAKTFYKLLLNFKENVSNFAVMNSKQKSYMQRAMAVIGSICRFHESGEDDSNIDFDEKLVIVKVSQLTWSNLPYSAYALLEEYIMKEDTTTRCHALRAMSGIFSSHPRIMYALQEQGLLQELMSEGSHPLLQLETLKCYQGILIAEESRIESGEAKRQMQANENITSSKQVSGDQDGDASLIGSCCAEQLSRLYEMMSSKYPEIRENSTCLIETLSRQGLLNPMEAIPPLIALQGDVRYPDIRAQSLKLLKVFVEKRPEMVRQLFTDGMKKSYYLQCAVYPEETVPTATLSHKDANGKMAKECIFKDIFENAIGKSRGHSKRMIKTLLNLFFTRNRGGLSTSESIPLLCYFTEILAYLPFTHLGDVLYILHLITEAVTLEGNELMGNLSRFLNSMGFSEVDPDTSVVDCFEKAAKKKNPSRVKELSTIHNSDFDISTFAKLCTKAASLALLVRLYFHLREAYKGVTEKRLAEYNPDEKERINDRGTCKSVNLSQFDSRIPSSLTASSKFDKDSMIQQYAIFRTLMRKFDNFFSIDGGDDKVTDSDTNTCESIDKKRKVHDAGNGEDVLARMIPG